MWKITTVLVFAGLLMSSPAKALLDDLYVGGNYYAQTYFSDGDNFPNTNRGIGLTGAYAFQDGESFI